MLAVKRRHYVRRAALEERTATVETETLPVLVQGRRGREGEGGDCGECRHPSHVEGDHGRDSGLLEHYLGHPHGVHGHRNWGRGDRERWGWG